MFKRDIYLNKLRSFKDTNVIKVITGIRRCGKSTLFLLYQDYLREQGIKEEQIISINFEDLDYEELLDYKKLYSYIMGKIESNDKYYVFLDEIQMVPSFEKAVDSLYIKANIDLYITGSNAYLLSGELATLLSGRYVSLFIMPLSFKEYIAAIDDDSDIQRKYIDYLLNSSFPGAVELKTQAKIKEYLAGIYNTIILKDVVERQNIQDVSQLEDVVRFVFDNIGNICSYRKIAGAMTSVGRKIAVSTVENYLRLLMDSFIIHKVSRYDIKGKQYLTTGNKYYLSDIGLRYYLLGKKPADQGHILENIVYLELLRRGYEVYIGKYDSNEVDFIATKDMDKVYFQVSYTVQNNETLERELRTLYSIKDHYPKILLTNDIVPPVSYDGIQQKNVLDWLLE